MDQSQKVSRLRKWLCQIGLHKWDLVGRTRIFRNSVYVSRCCGIGKERLGCGAIMYSKEQVALARKSGGLS